MPHIDTAEFQHTLNAFNKKYGTAFNYERYEGRKIGFDVLNISNSGDASYNVAIAEVYEQALTAAVGGKVQRFDSRDLIRDFEKMVMTPYREKCERVGEPRNSTYMGGRSETEMLEAIQGYLQNAPKSKVDVYSNMIKNRELQLRNIRNYANQAENSAALAPQALTYVAALDKVVQERTFAWKLRHPIQAYCERRDLKNLKEQLRYDENKERVDRSEEYINEQLQAVGESLAEARGAEMAENRDRAVNDREHEPIPLSIIDDVRVNDKTFTIDDDSKSMSRESTSSL